MSPSLPGDRPIPVATLAPEPSTPLVGMTTTEPLAAAGARRRPRRLSAGDMTEGPGTRLPVCTARLIEEGVWPRRACEAAIAAVVTRDAIVRAASSGVISSSLSR